MAQLHRIILCTLPLLLCACGQTPQQALLGRWFNAANSIRFNPDGTVLWNARSGLATGQYFFTGEERQANSGRPVGNLDLRLRAGDRDIEQRYEVQIMSNDRMRLMPVRADGSGQSERVIVLKRAAPDDTALFGEAAIPDTQASRR